MAKQIKFALEMNGVKIRSIEELQENFEIEAAVKYFLDGKLATWLEQRLYEKEEENVRSIDRNSPTLKEELCNALGVEYEYEADFDVDEIERLNEKTRILKEKTDDNDIIANASKTAFNQEDLADLLAVGEDTIYLCGDKFTIPIKYNNKKYIGILNIPKIKIKATNQTEIDNNGIVFENVSLPWAADNISPSNDNISTMSTPYELHKSLPIEQLQGIFSLTWRLPNNKKATLYPYWHVTDPRKREGYINSIEKSEQTLIIQILGQGKYTEKDCIYIRVAKDMKEGFMLTNNSICFWGPLGKVIIYYDSINKITSTGNNLCDIGIIINYEDKFNYVITKENACRNIHASYQWWSPISNLEDEIYTGSVVDSLIKYLEAIRGIASL